MRRQASWLLLVGTLLLSFVAVGGDLPSDATAKKKRAQIEATANILNIAKSTGIANGAGASVMVSCPNGTHQDFKLAGGGFSGAAVPLYPAGFVPGWGYTQFLVSNPSGATQRGFTGYATCLKTSQLYYPVGFGRQVSPGKGGGTTKSCPSGTYRLGGMFLASSFGLGRTSNITASYPNGPTGWTVTMSNRENTKTANLYGWLMCVKSPVLEVRDVSAQASARPGVRTSRHVSCPSGWEIAGGGFRLPTFGRLRVYNSYPVSTATGDSWVATVSNSGTTTVSFTAYAVCARPLPFT
jgi:hypothetical protein